jgi:hypothetical protein
MAQSTPKKYDPAESRREQLLVGAWIMLMLAVLTLGEYIVGVIAAPWGNLLLLVAAFKAFYVVKNYMHIGRLFSSSEDGH